MKTRIHITILACLSLLMLVMACKPKLEAPAADAGPLDFTHFVAVGNSITAGYADGALYYEGQQNSLAKLIAQQFQLAQSFTFKQPLVSPNSVGIGSTLNARYALYYEQDCNSEWGLTPKPVAVSGDLTIFASNIYATDGPFNNMGVPGVKSFMVSLAGYGNPGNGAGKYNPFFTRMASNPATASVLGDAMLQTPTFFTLFIGNNDVLLYALAGGSADSITITPIFNASMDGIVSTLTSGGAKGVIATVPDITSIPYFTTVPYNGLVLTATQAAQLNAYHAVAHAGNTVTFVEGANGFIIADGTAPGGIRMMTAGEYLTLPVSTNLKCNDWGSQIPITAQYVITATEASAISAAVSAYNAKIAALASTYNLALVDVNAFLASANTGLVYNGVDVNAAFVSGGAFSLDGVHLTPLGNAGLANEFLTAINAHYGSAIPLLNVTSYRGVQFP